jgi:hypothetical protein
MRSLSLLLCLIASPAFAQLELSQQAMSRLVDVAAVETIDDLVFVETGSAITTKPVVILTATTDAANVQVEASDMARMPVEFRDLGEGRYLFEKPGKAWVDVTVIDFAKNIFAKKTVVVEVGISPPTPPGPTPVPPGPTPVPPGPTPPQPPGPVPPEDGKFDNLASRSRAAAVGLGVNERTQIADLLVKVADRMQAFQIVQAQQALYEISKGWPACQDKTACQALWKILADDAKGRQLGWQEMQEYYRTIARGVRP